MKVRRSWSVLLAALVVVASAGAAWAQENGSSRSTPARAVTSFTLVAAADIACQPSEAGVPPTGMANGPDNCEQAVTASLVESLKPAGVAIPGDIQYERGQLSEFQQSFDLSWGAFKNIIYPAPGNHEWYDATNGQGYFDYFDGVGRQNGRAGPRGKGYYSVDLNRYWHLITLNSNCTADNPLIVTPVPCERGSAQERWLRADLASHRGKCIIAQWHHPLFTSGPNQGGPNDRATASFWQDLYAARATLVLNGHDHGYELFAPQTAAGKLDRARGVREFVLGTGGKSLFGPGPATAANSEIYNNTAFGVVLFGLRPHGYQWHFFPARAPGNGRFTDQGSAPCNSAKNRPPR